MCSKAEQLFKEQQRHSKQIKTTKSKIDVQDVCDDSVPTKKTSGSQELLKVVTEFNHRNSNHSEAKADKFLANPVIDSVKNA